MTVQANDHIEQPLERAAPRQNLLLTPRGIAVTLLRIVGVLLVFNFLGLLAIYDPFFELFRRFFEFDQEQSVSTWFAGFLLFSSALLLTVITQNHMHHGRPYVRHWFYLSIFFMLMSLDEVAGLHEQLLQLGDVLGTSGFFTFAWVIPGLVVVILFALAYLKFALALPHGVRRLLIISLGLFIFGALGMEMINGWIIDNFDVHTVVYILQTTVEETFEKVGVILFIYTLLVYLRDHCDVSVLFRQIED